MGDEGCDGVRKMNRRRFLELLGSTPFLTGWTHGNAGFLPADRQNVWVPGLMAVGGIPVRNTVFTTLTPTGGGVSDQPQIQTAINNCPVGQVVALAAGTFSFNGGIPVILNKAITLRGAGPGQTILFKTDGGQPQIPFTASITGSVMTVTAMAIAGQSIFVGMLVNGSGVPGNITVSSFGTGTGTTGTYNLSSALGTPVASEAMLGSSVGTNAAPIIIIGPTEFGIQSGPPDGSSNSSNLTVDAAKGAFSITVASSAAFSVGQIVLLDELSGAQWMPDNIPGNAADGYQVWAAPDYRVTWRLHKPLIPGGEDFIGANFTGSIAGTVLTVTAVSGTQGPGIATGEIVLYPGSPAGLAIVAGGTGTGLTGTYNLSANVGTVGSQTMQSCMFPFQGGTFGDTYSRLDRVTNEIKEIASIVGNVITFTSPITISYRVSHTAQLTWFNDSSSLYVPHTRNAGIEEMSLQAGNNGNLWFNAAAYCWAKHIEAFQWGGVNIELINSFRCEVRNSYLHDAIFPRPDGGAYAFGLDFASSEILMENCISIMTNKVMVARAGGAGSVIAYNYTDMGMIDFTPSWVEVGINGSHLVGPHHILFEGNYGVNADSDNTHGAAVYHTFFRNWMRGIRHSFVDPNNGITVDDASQPGNGPVRGGGLQSYSYFMSFVGNVIGASGQMATWVYQPSTGGLPAVWLLGWDVDHNNQPSFDPVVVQNVIRDGNWDWLTSSQKWENTPATFPIPNSLYLPGKPAFFGANPWPWTNPSNGTTGTLPAKARFDAGTPNA